MHNHRVFLLIVIRIGRFVVKILIKRR